MPQKAEDPVPSAPLWALSYGDMMSLLLTFFILLFSMSTITKEKFTAIAGSLEDALGGSNTTTPKTLSPEDLLQKLLNKSDVEDGVEVLAVSGYNFRVTTVREGVKITVGGKALFEKGKADLDEEAKKALRNVAGLLVGYRNRVRIVGHAEPSEDTELDRERFRDLHDLGYQRAKVVFAFLSDEKELQLGEGTESMRVHPARVELATDGPWNRAVSNLGEGQSEPGGRAESGKIQNRRVEMVVSEELVPWELLR